jgi:pimeloyl-ACP methyl ester carboxylesterase
VDALFLPATDDTSTKPKPLLIFGHGNGEVIDYWVAGLDGFRERGIAVLLVEYPGYGRSSGSPSERSIRQAMDAAYDLIASDPRVDPTRVMGFGQSLGGGAICLLAKDRPLRALILESTFPSLDIFAAGYGAPAFLLRDHFNNLATVAKFPGPILVIHGRDDQLIPWQQAQRLAQASTHATFRLYECGHGCWDPDHLPFWRDALPFLKDAGMLPPVADRPVGASAPASSAPGSMHVGPALDLLGFLISSLGAQRIGEHASRLSLRGRVAARERERLACAHLGLMGIAVHQPHPAELDP